MLLQERLASLYSVGSEGLGSARHVSVWSAGQLLRAVLHALRLLRLARAPAHRSNVYSWVLP